MTVGRVTRVALVGAMLMLAGMLGAAQTSEPTFSEVESLKLQNYALQAQTIQAQMALLQSAMRDVELGREALLVGIERAHPGWRVDRQTLKWDAAPAPKK
jgi:hypothetical protein